MEDNLQLNELTKEARNGSIIAQKILYTKCLKLIQPIIYRYKNYANFFGINEQDLNDLMNDTFFKLMSEGITHYFNFVSYFRKKYEYDILKSIKKIKTKGNKQFRDALNMGTNMKYSPFEEERTIVEEVGENDTYSKTDLYLFLKKYSKVGYFKDEDLGFYTYFLRGYKISEIAPICKVSEYKVRNSLKKARRKMLNINEENDDKLLTC